MVVWVRVAPAAFCRNQPINVIHIPFMKLPPVKIVYIPKAIKPNAANSPVKAAIRVALLKSREIAQTIARNTRPPSNGKPGIMLNNARLKLMRASQILGAARYEMPLSSW